MRVRGAGIPKVAGKSWATTLPGARGYDTGKIAEFETNQWHATLPSDQWHQAGDVSLSTKVDDVRTSYLGDALLDCPHQFRVVQGL